MKRINRVLDGIWESKWKDALLPLCFVWGNLVNIGFFYLGLAFKENIVREYGFAIAQLAFAILCGLAFLSMLRHAKLSKGSWLLLAAVLVFFAANFAAGLYTYGVNSRWKQYAVHFVCFCIPAFLGGAFARQSRSERRLAALLERLSFFTLPAGIIMFNGALFACNPFRGNRDLGMLSYMTVAYTFMPFLLSHILRFVEKAELEIPVIHKKIRRPQPVRLALIVVYWMSIICTGTRGTIVCVAIFSVAVAVSAMLHRDGVKRAVLAAGVVGGMFFFVMFVYTPPGAMAAGRMGIFIDGLENGELVTSLGDSPGIGEKLDDLVAADGGWLVVNRPPGYWRPYVPGVVAENLTVASRETLFKLAWKEFLKSPVRGMGLTGYPLKYYFYPHNAVLELLGEGGLLLGVPLLLLALLAAVRLLCMGWKDRSVRWLLLILMAYAARASISGSVWMCDALMILYGYAFAQKANTGQKKRDEILKQGH